MDTYTKHNPDAPWNEIEVNEPEVVETWKNLTEAYESGYSHVFVEKQKEAVQKQKDLIYALESVDSGLTGMAKAILKLIS